ncbi:MAG: hypothetical protein CMA10_04800 [Euryarchaeota archaeon]|nr:hypothetical protein [Euryarchaeota archaeon]|tara:strand:+ start:389 stop:1093 length:705 start_codon:yes stop_codon:yes gene_type:complete
MAGGRGNFIRIEEENIIDLPGFRDLFENDYGATIFDGFISDSLDGETFQHLSNLQLQTTLCISNGYSHLGDDQSIFKINNPQHTYTSYNCPWRYSAEGVDAPAPGALQSQQSRFFELIQNNIHLLSCSHTEILTQHHELVSKGMGVDHCTATQLKLWSYGNWPGRKLKSLENLRKLIKERNKDQALMVKMKLVSQSIKQIQEDYLSRKKCIIPKNVLKFRRVEQKMLSKLKLKK